jgi:hypothetical protein
VNLGFYAEKIAINNKVITTEPEFNVIISHSIE